MTIKKLTILSLSLAPTLLAEPVWKQDGASRLELRDADVVIARFILDAAPRDPHFDWFATADGRNTVWVGPEDHTWHYGLWFSWKTINGVNFWETQTSTGKQQGLNRIEEPSIEVRPDGETAVIRYREFAYPNSEETPVLVDSLEIEIRRPSAKHGLLTTWNVTTTALADVVLDRTPIPGQPGGREWGGYGGFSWRGAKAFEDVRFTDSESRSGMDIHGKRARWVDATGMLEGSPAGVVILEHPGNAFEASAWYLFDNSKYPFWFANPAPLFAKAVSLKKGESMKQRYRIIVHDGSWGSAEVEEASRAFGLAP